MLRHFLILLILTYASYKDIKTLEIPDLCPVAIAVIGLFSQRDLKSALLVCAIYFVLLLAFSAASKAIPIGMGDAKLFAAMSFCLGIDKVLSIFAISSLLSGAFAAYLLLKGRAKSYQFPFCPFISAGFFCIALLSGIPST